MNEWKGNNAPQIDELVFRYETNAKKGIALFLDERSFFKLIEFYEQEQQLDKALEVANQAISRYMFSIDFYLRKAELLIDMSKEEGAIEILNEANTFAPGQLEISLLKAEALAYLERKDEALALLDTCKLKDGNPKTLSEIYLLESLVHEYNQDHELMFTVLSKAIKNNPRHEEVLERLWLAVELNRKYKESIDLHKAVIDAHPYSHMAWYNLGHAHAYFGDYENAIDAYEFSFAINPKFDYAYRDCADLCFETKQYKKALGYYLEILNNAETEGDLFQKIGECHQQLGSCKKAANYFRQALKMNPLNDEVYFHYAQCYVHQNKWEGAAHYFKKAIEIEDRREEYFIALAEAQFQLTQYADAETNYRKAVEIAPEESVYWLNYASFLIATERIEDAKALLNVAEVSSDISVLQFGQIACLFKLGQRKEACQRLWEALEEDFNHHGIIFELIPELESDIEIQTINSAYR